MRGVDLNRYPFDFDLTFSVLLMHPDGTVYHRYGGRDHRGADVWLNRPSFQRLLEKTREEHEVYSSSPSPPPLRKRRVIEEIPAFAKKDKGECVHCHSVFPALREDLRNRGQWDDSEDLWRYPSPERLGIQLDPLDQTLLSAVRPKSVADRGGLRSRDRLVELNRSKILSATDVQWVLQGLPAGETEVPVVWLRSGKRQVGTLSLADGWKRGTPLTFSWRPLKWALLPAPGFGGRGLSRSEKRSLGLDPDRFGFRVSYLVTWGENRRFGRAAQKSGLRKGDVVLSFDEKADFYSVDHFHSWWRFTKEPGDRVKVEILRNGKRSHLEIPVLE